MSKEICPFMTRATKDGTSMYCFHDKCALWSEHRECCSQKTPEPVDPDLRRRENVVIERACRVWAMWSHVKALSGNPTVTDLDVAIEQMGLAIGAMAERVD